MKGQRKGVRGMDRGGRAEQGSLVGTDGLFPRYQGKACIGTPQSGRVIVNLGGTAEASNLCPNKTAQVGLWDEGHFYTQNARRLQI